MYFIRLFVDIILGKYCSTMAFEIMFRYNRCKLWDCERPRWKREKTLVYTIDGNNDNLIAT